jgi:nitroreductase
MDVIEAIKTRRSIRKFKTDPIDDKTLEVVLEAARLAPSWANTQAWRFIVVKDSQIKARLAETLIAGAMPKNPSAAAFITAPVLIVGCAEQGVSGFYDKKPSTDKGEYWYMFDVALAMENMALAAHSLGLGTVQVGLFDARKANSILEIPLGFCVVVMTPLGYPEFQPGARPRKELSEIVFKDKFGQK